MRSALMDLLLSPPGQDCSKGQTRESIVSKASACARRAAGRSVTGEKPVAAQRA